MTAALDSNGHPRAVSSHYVASSSTRNNVYPSESESELDPEPEELERDLEERRLRRPRLESESDDDDDELDDPDENLRALRALSFFAGGTMWTLLRHIFIPVRGFLIDC